MLLGEGVTPEKSAASALPLTKPKVFGHAHALGPVESDGYFGPLVK